MQYRPPPKRLAFAVPKALMETRIGKTRTAEPKTASPHVYEQKEVTVEVKMTTNHSDDVRTEQGRFAHDREVRNVRQKIENDDGRQCQHDR